LFVDHSSLLQGGSAAAVAEGLVPFALGTDTGGSVRQPASHCGIVGFKPSYGAVSRYGVIPYANSLDTVGVLATSVSDARLVFAAIRGRDPRDPSSLPGRHDLILGPDRGHVEWDREDYFVPTDEQAQRVADDPVDPSSDLLSAGAWRADPRDTRAEREILVGVPDEAGVLGLSPAVADAWQAAVDALDGARSRCGALTFRAVPVSLPASRHAIAAYYSIAMSEAASNLSRYDGARIGSRADDGSVAQSRARLLGREVVRRVLTGNFITGAGRYDAYVARARQVRRLVARDHDRVLGLGGVCDFLLTPACVTEPPLPSDAAAGTGASERAAADAMLEAYAADALSAPASLAGAPAVVVPAVRAGQGRLPIGLQLVGAYGRDERLLAAAVEVEHVLLI
jgi:aspartyl-tRNA(Asn)/glutamyl-tRNA(Gln) amidotransferase subunit A